MASGKKGGLINRILVGSEKSEGYARASLPSNRWELFWDIFKGRFWKLFGLNLLMILFFLPIILLFFFRSNVIDGYGSIYPFSEAFGVGYLAPSSLQGFRENIVYNVDVVILLLLPLFSVIASVGISGGAYVMRNIVWTEGVFVANDFWRGVKQNFKQICTIALIYSLLFYLSMMSISLAKYYIAIDSDKKWLFIISELLSISCLIFFSLVACHAVMMSVTYELKLRHLIKNSFLFSIGLFPQSLFFLGIGIIPFLISSVGGIISIIGVLLVILFGFSLLFLIWTNFCQWGYDKFINDKIGAKKNRGIYEKVKEENSEALKQYRAQIALTARSSLNSKPIKPITDDEITIAELPTSFNRSDIIKLNESKKALIEDNERYIKEHENDPEYQFNESDAMTEKADKERQKRIEQAKKELSKRKFDD